MWKGVTPLGAGRDRPKSLRRKGLRQPSTTQARIQKIKIIIAIFVMIKNSPRAARATRREPHERRVTATDSNYTFAWQFA